MLEIPEAICMARQLNDALKGKTVADVTSMQSPHKFAFLHGDPAGYPDLLMGKTFLEAENHGSWVVMTFGDAQFMVSEGTRLLYTPEGGKLPKKHQMLIRFEDDSHLSASIQMYGGLVCAVRGTYDNEYFVVSVEKPPVPDSSFNKKYFQNMISDEANQNKSAKAFLATDQRIPGLGNGVLQDILFNARIHPRTKVMNLSQEQVDGLFKALKATIKEMIEAGGRDTEKDLYGNDCGYVTKMSKNTVGKPCPVCGTIIEKANYIGGSIYFCKTCQPEQK